MSILEFLSGRAMAPQLLSTSTKSRLLLSSPRAPWPLLLFLCCVGVPCRTAIDARSSAGRPWRRVARANGFSDHDDKNRCAVLYSVGTAQSGGEVTGLPVT